MKATVLTCSICLDKPRLANSQWCRLCWQAWWWMTTVLGPARQQP